MEDPGKHSEAIRAEGLCRYFRMGGEVIRAVDGVTLVVREGEFIALLGSSGSGKSTLLNLIGGLDRPTSGAIFVNGSNLAQMTSEELARHRRRTVGMVFQAFNLIPSMSLEENVELPLRFAEVERRERQARVRKALEQVGLIGRVRHRPSELSGGEQQRASLARALVNQPLILLADEPTGNLDSRNGEEVLRLMREISRSFSTTVVLVTHARTLADRFADRILFISDGKLVLDGAKQ